MPKNTLDDIIVKGAVMIKNYFCIFLLAVTNAAAAIKEIAAVQITAGTEELSSAVPSAYIPLPEETSSELSVSVPVVLPEWSESVSVPVVLPEPSES